MKVNTTGLIAGLAAGFLAAGPLLVSRFRTGVSSGAPSVAIPVPPLTETNDAAAVFTKFLEANPAGEPGEKALALCAALTAKDCARLLEHAEKLKAGPAWFRALASRWAALNHRAALHWVMRHRDLKDFKSIAGGVMAVFAAKEPAEFAAWYGAQQDVPELTREAFAALLSADPQALVKAVLARPGNVPLEIMGGTIRNAGSAERMMTAIRKTGTNPARPFARVELEKRCRRIWITMDAASWFRWELARPESDYPPFERSGLPLIFAETILSTPNPGETAAKALGIMNAADRQSTIERLADLWADLNPDAAGTWLNTLPDTPERWPALATFANGCAAEDPVSAMAWAGAIGDESLRLTTERNVLLKWAAADREGAESWLQESQWTPSSKEEMRERLAVISPADR